VNIRIYLIFLETRIIDLHFAADTDSMCRSSFIHLFCFSGGLCKTIFFHKYALWPFKVIQGHWFWCQSKACMRLPISLS